MAIKELQIPNSYKLGYERLDTNYDTDYSIELVDGEIRQMTYNSKTNEMTYSQVYKLEGFKVLDFLADQQSYLNVINGGSFVSEPDWEGDVSRGNAGLVFSKKDKNSTYNYREKENYILDNRGDRIERWDSSDSYHIVGAIKPNYLTPMYSKVISEGIDENNIKRIVFTRRTYTNTKEGYRKGVTLKIGYNPNKAPSISGKDENLGNISDEIKYNYTVFDEDNDSLSIVERLNNTVINVRNDVKSGTEFTLTVPKADIYKLPIGQKNTISIEVSDGQEKVYRNLSFVRTNTAPVIQVLTSKDLGEIIAPFTTKLKVTDEEKDGTRLEYRVNQVVLDKDKTYKRVTIHTDKKENVALGTEISYTIPADLFKTMIIGDYELSIRAIDVEAGESEEVIKFKRTEDTIAFETKGIETTTMPKQFIALIQLTGSPKHSKVQACNNGLDKSPAWEDVTEHALSNTPYSFKNTTKTASKWAVRLKVDIDGKDVK